MTTHLTSALDLLAEQRRRQATILPQFGDDKVVGFMATSAAPGSVPAVGIRRISSVTPGPSGAEAIVALQGPLPRAPERGECITVAATAVSDFRGFQMKTHVLVDPAFASRLHGAGPDGARVHAAQVFTIQQGPKSADFFEKVPVDELTATVARAGYALVAVGEQANLSPRWILHHEVRDGALELYSGDAFWSKTWLNVRRNPREVRLVLDPDTGRGFAMEGASTEFTAQDHPAAAGKVQAMFERIGVRKIARMTRLRVERIAPIGVGE
ncbi:MAG TPA: hypothetical protein VLT47_03070 [Anaeromyxobacteraceae bacterium]|nr:hypothetical protein [Anaeromyxobacteraceae bacterium]